MIFINVILQTLHYVHVGKTKMYIITNYMYMYTPLSVQLTYPSLIDLLKLEDDNLGSVEFMSKIDKVDLTQKE